MEGYCNYFECFCDDYEELEQKREEYSEYCLQGCENCEYWEK